MKICLLVLFCLFLIVNSNAQDLIIKVDGSEIKAKVIELKQNTVFYQKNENLNGPLYTSALSDVFMIIYANGTHETFEVKFKDTLNKIDNKKSDKEICSLSDDNFEVKLLSAENVADKPNLINVKANLAVYRNGAFFSELKLNAYQYIDKKLDYSNPNGKYNSSSNIVIASEKFAKILFEKFESVFGKGYGWALSPDFFYNVDKDCSVAFLTQNGFNREQGNSRAGTTFKKIALRDCSSIEKKLLSIALIWLDVNFLSN